MYLKRNGPNNPGVVTSWKKQRQNTKRQVQDHCAVQNVKCTPLYTPTVTAVAENTNGIDSAATQPKLRRMNASSDLSEYAAKYRQSVASQCGNDAGAANSPDSAEHIWQAPLPESEGSSNDSTSDETDVNTIDDWLADRFRTAARAIEERRSFITEYVLEGDDGNELCHRRYYIHGREVTEDYFSRKHWHPFTFEVLAIGRLHRGNGNNNTAVAGV